MLKGWKTNTGLIIGVIGGALLAGADVAPSPELAVWLKFVGTILMTIGAGGAIYGVGDKSDRALTKLNGEK